MTYTDTASTIRGATRQSWRASNPRAMLKALMDQCDDPHDPVRRDAILENVMEIIHSKRGLKFIDTIVEYWFTNSYRALLIDYPKEETAEEKAAREKAEALRAAARAAIAEQAAKTLDDTIEHKAEQKARMLLDDVIAPNGKKLGDCTGRECLGFGNSFTSIGKALKPEDVVRDKLSEARVRKLWGKQAGP